MRPNIHHLAAGVAAVELVPKPLTETLLFTEVMSVGRQIVAGSLSEAEGVEVLRQAALRRYDATWKTRKDVTIAVNVEESCVLETERSGRLDVLLTAEQLAFAVQKANKAVRDA